MMSAKKVKDRKRHILVDTLELVLLVVVHSASIQDRDGAKAVLEKMPGFFNRLARTWADGAYAGQLIEWVKTTCHCVLEIVKRSDTLTGFRVLLRHLVVERTFRWLNRYRRLAKGYERLPESSEAMIHIALIRLMLARLARKQQAEQQRQQQSCQAVKVDYALAA